MISKGDMVTIVTHRGVVFSGKVLALDDKTITLKLYGRRIVTIYVDTVKEIKVIRRAGEVK
jgi:hypothetical protein